MLILQIALCFPHRPERPVISEHHVRQLTELGQALRESEFDPDSA